MFFLKEILSQRKEIVKYAQDNFVELKETAETSDNIKYSSSVSGIGCICPSLINFKIHPNRKKGRLSVKKPSLERYTEYTFDSNNSPLRIRKFNKYGCDLTTYFFRIDDYTCAVPLCGDTTNDYLRYVYIYKFLKGRIVEYAEVDNVSVYFEKYTYPSDHQKNIICEMFEYLDFSIEYNSDDLSGENTFFNFLKEKITKNNYKENIYIKSPSSQIDPTLKKFKYIISSDNGIASKIEEYVIEDDVCTFNRVIK